MAASEPVAPLPRGFRHTVEPDGTVVLIESPAINGVTVLVLLVGVVFAIGGVELVAGSGIQPAAVGWGLLYAAIGFAAACVGGSQTFVRRRWRLQGHAICLEFEPGCPCRPGGELWPARSNSRFATS